MPAFEKEYQRGGTEWSLLPEEIFADPQLNGRFELPNIDWIVESVLRVGQLQPVLIRKTGGKPVLVAGFSRWRAVSKINAEHLAPKPLRLRCSYTQQTEKEAFLNNIEENRVRNATTPIDDAHNILRLMNVYQMTIEEVKDAYRAESTAWVKNRLVLIEAIPAVEKQIRKGAIKGPAARAVAKVSKEHQQNLAALAEKTGKVTLEDVNREMGLPEKPQAPVAAPEAPHQPVPAPIATVCKQDCHCLNSKSLSIELARATFSEDLTPTDMLRLAGQVLLSYDLKV